MELSKEHACKQKAQHLKCAMQSMCKKWLQGCLYIHLQLPAKVYQNYFCWPSQLWIKANVNTVFLYIIVKRVRKDALDFKHVDKHAQLYSHNRHALKSISTVSIGVRICHKPQKILQVVIPWLSRKPFLLFMLLSDIFQTDTTKASVNGSALSPRHDTADSLTCDTPPWNILH